MCTFLNTLGFDCFLLKYRVPTRDVIEGDPVKGVFGWAPLMDVQRAIGLVRSQSQNYKNVGVLGFSAGGHLAAHISTTGWLGDRSYPRIDDNDDKSCKPDFTSLIYPAYLNGVPNDSSKTTASPEVTPDEESPPFFLSQTQDDGYLSVLGFSLNVTSVSTDAGTEVHMFPSGGHGYGMCINSTHVPGCDWPDRLKSWLEVSCRCKQAKKASERTIARCSKFLFN